MKSIGIGIAAAVLLVGAGGKPGHTNKTKPYASDSAAAHARDVLKWRSERVANLRKPDGWLSLAGLFWLDEGENKFGSAVSNKVRFPEKAPEKMGSFFLENGKVRVRVNGGVPVTSDGKPVTELELKTDEGGGDPTTLALGPLTWYVIKRADRYAVRIKDREAPGIRRFQGIRYYPIRESWRIVARFEPYVPPQQIKVPNITGQIYDENTPGALVFERDGKTYWLDPILESPDADELFVIFGDATNGRDTYGGGRFLYTARPGPDHKVVLDFNRAYNPPCAFTPWATCPLPPSQNKLPIAVEAGERAYGDKGVVGPGHMVN